MSVRAAISIAYCISVAFTDDMGGHLFQSRGLMPDLFPSGQRLYDMHGAQRALDYQCTI
jgi:hypothetical protein